MPLEFDTLYKGIPIKLWLDKVEALGPNVRAFMEWSGYLPDEPRFDETSEVDIVFSDGIETDVGFDIEVYAVNKVGPWTSFQLDAEFPVGVDFFRATPGEDIGDIGFGYQSADGHKKEGLVGAYTGTPLTFLDLEEPGHLCTLHFHGPYAASFLIRFRQVKMAFYNEYFTIADNERISNFL